MVAYTKQTWHNKPAIDTPLGASRMTHIEDGIGTAQDTADSAISAASAASSAAASAASSAATANAGVAANATAISGKVSTASLDKVIILRRYASGAWPVRGTIPTGAVLEWESPMSIGFPPTTTGYALVGDRYTRTVG
jgi:hypothetical protein